MKNSRLNISALIAAAIVLSLGFSSEKAAAQTKTSAKSVSTTKKPPSLKTATKAAPQNSTPKAQETAQIIVAATSVRIRREPDFAAETVQTARIGEVFSLLEQNADWCKIRLGKTDDESASGWIAKKLTREFTGARRGEIYRAVADKYLKQSSPASADLAQVTDFLTRAQKEFKDANSQADFAFRRLLALKTTLDRIPFEKQTENPFAEFIEKNKGEIVYSDPSGKWLVRSELFWALREKYKNLPVAEEIAWAAAQNPIPGECEGYVNCYLYLLRATEGEYLNFYPNGKYSRQALKNLTEFLEPIAADANQKAVYSSATDTSDRADFNKYLTELRAIVSKTPHLEKSKTLAQIKRIAEAYR
ncbi:MAG TPA: SH3 domain-containing protein [Pyrinomonadaceae bacterium]|jgi:hypothetical protein